MGRMSIMYTNSYIYLVARRGFGDPALSSKSLNLYILKELPSGSYYIY